MHICCQENHVLRSFTITTWTNPRSNKNFNYQQHATPNLSKLKSFLGMLSFCHHFIKDFSTIAAPLRYLTNKDVPFQWTKQQQHAFNTLQHTLCSSETLAFYNPNADIHLTVDASPQGLGTILSQSQLDGSYCPVSYGPRLLTDVETIYSEMERESLAVLWACKHFYYYVYYRNFTI